jgi:hypothetical protein
MNYIRLKEQYLKKLLSLCRNFWLHLSGRCKKKSLEFQWVKVCPDDKSPYWLFEVTATCSICGETSKSYYTEEEVKCLSINGIRRNGTKKKQ